MISTLSYLNLIFSVLYFLEYLQNSNPFVIGGLLAVVIFNWMALRNQEKNQFQWTFVQWITALLTVCFAVFTGYSAVVVLLGAIEYHYYPAAAILLVTAGLLFAITILFHLYLNLDKSIRKKSDQLFDN
jgi:hypothetical protein